jgi:hypothetical protein
MVPSFLVRSRIPDSVHSIRKQMFSLRAALAFGQAVVYSRLLHKADRQIDRIPVHRLLQIPPEIGRNTGGGSGLDALEGVLDNFDWVIFSYL